MVEARDQVLMTFFSPASFILRILASSRGWTKALSSGFCSCTTPVPARKTSYRPLLLAAPDDETARGLLLVTRAVALGRDAPRGDRMTAGGLVLALATAV